MEKTVSYYMNLPYVIEMWRDEDGDWIIRVPLLKGLMTHGNTREHALEMLDEAMALWLEVALERGMEIPEPQVEKV